MCLTRRQKEFALCLSLNVHLNRIITAHEQKRNENSKSSGIFQTKKVIETDRPVNKNATQK